ncbi:MAG: glycine cleavage system aminomethyltransferase GcvT [Endomicrobium sp.]|jgi:glycine cleavage system T protein|nr:glycine cleavage system aminomethyltransferase GcvT [Endomicrobium sp.]
MKKLFLFSEHEKLGAKFMEFCGWEMPVQYTSVIDEHNAVRTNVGVFDISHMGTLIITGIDAEKFLNWMTLGNILGLPDKRAKYSMFLNEDGGVKDDVIVYRLNDEYMVVVNAGNLKKDFDWLNKHKIEGVEIKSISDDICMIAVQGPKADKVLLNISEIKFEDMRYFTVSKLKLKDINASFCRIARTGYTGEDGFEIFISKKHAVDLWQQLMDFSVKPCGLGCRDTLRLEACMPLHGHEINENINPIDAGFQQVINWSSDFMGKTNLLPLRDAPLKKMIVFECMSGIARNSNEVFANGKKIGYVTSGSFSPTLKKSIGMALIDANVNLNGLEIMVRDNRRKIKVVTKPFYKRQK